MKKSLFLFCSLVGSALQFSPALAQVTPDGTTSTTVDAIGNDFTIQQGDRAGSNLFHSFGEFSVPTDGSAFFNNAANIVNIFSRVTGGNISSIDGLLRANGSASLFLLNPAGILFGPNARLDIGGSFFSTTADSFLFEDGEFSATDLDNPPLLTINAPIGLNFRDHPGNIVNRSVIQKTAGDIVGLEVLPGQNITLLGGNINLERGNITAPGGIVELGGLLAAGVIDINPDGSLSFPDGTARANVTLNNQAEVKVRANDSGAININANQLELKGESLLAAGIEAETGFPQAQADNITINSNAIFASGDSQIRNENLGIGNAGNIDITTGTLKFTEGSAIVTSNFGQGNAGNVNINATGNVSFNGDSGGVWSTSGFTRNNDEVQGVVGDGGNITVTANTLSLNNRSTLENKASGIGDGGDVTINASNLFLNDGRIVTNTIGIGDAGNITINVTDDTVLLNANQVFATLIIAQAEKETTLGNAGNIEINTKTLSLNGALILADSLGQGNAGDITINATDSVFLDSADKIPNSLATLILSQVLGNAVGNGGEITISAPQIYLENFSLISTNASQNSIGKAGKINLNANTIKIANGSVIDTLTENNFDAGDININANFLELNSGGKIVTSNDRGGNAGNINLNINGDIVLNNGNPPYNFPFDEQILREIELKTGIFANNFPNSKGDGGNIFIVADSIQFEDQGSILVETVSGQGGNINLKVNDFITLRNNSIISSEAGGAFGDGGSINIDTNFIVAFPNQNNDILADAQTGEGGNINIAAEALFGIEERPLNPITNDINASSEFGLDGTVSITTPDINRIQTDIEIPNNIVETETLGVNACAGRATTETSTFIVKGKGGIPPQPTEPFMADALIPDGKPITIDKETDVNSLLVEESETEQVDPYYIPPDIKPIKTSMGDIYPARGVIKTEDGRVILTTYPTDNVNTRTPHNSANCTP